MIAPRLTFTRAEAEHAAQTWGANCGPAALAFALQVSLDTVRPLIPGFDEKHYTSPRRMKAALKAAGRSYTIAPASRATMFDGETIALVRIQWTGPWTAPGAHPIPAYFRTHWIATFIDDRDDPRYGGPTVFDINAGVVSEERWTTAIVPMIIKQYPRADGGWFPTHVWRLA